MFLRSLSLRGFKSFADKTEMTFHPGVIAIVGPNGSGKSNISDAVLWVLGEQSAKHLRGTSMEDVIFAGSHSRATLGMAEVLLTLDNSCGTIPIEFTEVTIGRRLYRSGESEYLLNGSPCRLLDIQDLLHEAGLGRGLYSVISQGRIDEVLSSRPEDRRSLIDEAAGILKHRRRKERALKKLDKVEQNLVRIHDIHNEVKRQLGPLRRQAEAARSGADLQKQLRTLQIQVAIEELKQLQTNWEQAGKAEEGLRSESASLEQAMAMAEQAVAARKKELDQIVTGSSSEGWQRERLIRVTERLRGQLHRSEQHVAHHDERKAALAENKEELVARVTALQEDLKAGGGEDGSTKQATAAAQTALEATRARLVKLRAHHEALTAEIKGSEREQAELRQKQAVLGTELQGISVHQGDLTKNRASGEERLGHERTKSNELRKERDNLSSDGLEDVKDKLARAEAALAQAEAAQHTLVGELADLKSEEATAREELAGCRAEESTLQNMLDESRSTISSRLPAKGSSSKIAGFLSELISYPSEYEAAIEAVLREEAAGLVIAEATAAIDIVSMAEGASGRLIMHALDLSRGPSAPLPETATRRSLARVIDVGDPSHESLRSLFADCYLVDDLRTAISEAAAAPGCRFVTMAGEIVGPGATICIGASGAEGSGALRLERLLRETKELREGLEATVAALQKQRGTLEKKVTSGSSVVKDRGAATAKARDEVAGLEARLRELDSLISLCDEAEARLVAELSSSTETLASLNERSTAISALLETIAGSIEAADSRTSSSVELLTGLAEEMVLAEEAVHTAQADAAAATESLRRAERQQQDNLREVDRLRSAVKKKEAAEATLERLGLELPELIELQKQLIEVADARLRILESARNDRRAVLNGHRDRINLAETESKRFALEVAARREELHRIELKQASMQAKVENSVRYLTEDLETPIDRAMRLEPLGVEQAIAKEEIRKLRSRLSNLGPINPVAIEECESLEERNKFLEEQLADLRQSKEGILEVIKELDERILDLFSSTFESCSNHFSEIFSLLFPGSRGKLILTDDNNLLDSGVDIEVRMAGKKFQKLSLLSGGERALSALAFTFALYATRPTPFCILDEVDAALDDFNIGRFVDLVERVRERSQFFIVTHQKRTMNSADIIYGVSMEPSGITTIVSQKVGGTKEAVEKVRVATPAASNGNGGPPHDELPNARVNIQQEEPEQEVVLD